MVKNKILYTFNVQIMLVMTWEDGSNLGLMSLRFLRMSREMIALWVWNSVGSLG